MDGRLAVAPGRGRHTIGGGAPGRRRRLCDAPGHDRELVCGGNWRYRVGTASFPATWRALTAVALTALTPPPGPRSPHQRPPLPLERRPRVRDRARQLRLLMRAEQPRLPHSPSTVSTISAPTPGTALTSIAASQPSLRSTQTHFGSNRRARSVPAPRGPTNHSQSWLVCKRCWTLLNGLGFGWCDHPRLQIVQELLWCLIRDQW